MWVVCAGLIIVRALIAAAESALYGTSDLRAKELSTIHPQRGQRVLRHKSEREATAASLRFGMVLSGFLAVAVATLVPPRLLDFSHLGDALWFSWLTPVSSALLVGVLASVADVTFRAAASANPERWALRLSGLVSLLVVTLYPFLRALVTLLNVLVRPFGTKVGFEAPAPPLEELEKLLAAQAVKNEVDKDAPQLIRSIFELSDKTCRDVMVPRTEVIAVDITTPSEEILKILSEENHSRMPVYQDDVDHIVGILHVRDLIPMMQHPELIVLSDIIRPAHFVPWVKSIGDLLREMQRRKIHMAMVVDEYGGFMGIVTLEDILREIVGDIGDEFEVDLKQVEKQPDGTFLVDAQMSVAELPGAIGLSLPEGDYETLGGFINSLVGHLPDVNERISWDGWLFTVHSKEGPRIDRVRVARLSKPSLDEAPQPVESRVVKPMKERVS